MAFFLFYELLGEQLAQVEQFGQKGLLEVSEVGLALGLVSDVILQVLDLAGKGVVLHQ